jgi:hypothetical protein
MFLVELSQVSEWILNLDAKKLLCVEFNRKLFEIIGDPKNL